MAKNGNGKGKEVAKIEAAPYAIEAISSADFKMLIRDTFGGEKLSPSDFPRIKVPAGGGKIWTVPKLGGEEDVKEFEAIVLHSQITRGYWPVEYDGSNDPPDCFSPDGMTGIGIPGGDCDLCSNAEWDSGKNGSQACRQRRVTFLAMPDSILPYVLSIPATSLKGFREYLVQLLSARQGASDVLTRFTLTEDKNSGGIKYSKVVAESTGPVPNPEAIKGYIAAIKPYIETTMKDMAQEANGSGEDVVVDSAEQKAAA